MKFTPLAPAEDQAPYLFPEGFYEVRVEDANETTVKNGQNAGKPQIQLKLKVIGDGQTTTVYDYLRSDGKKLRNFCSHAGLEDKYQNGEILDADCMYKKLHASVKVENNEKYGDQNKIAFYVSKSDFEESKVDKVGIPTVVGNQSFNGELIQDQDIPF